MNGQHSRLEQMRQAVYEQINSNLLQQARTLCQQLCHESSQDAENWLLMASIHARFGALGEVAACCRKAADLHPGNAMAHFNLGVALQMQGDPAAAADSYREVLRVAPGHIPALSNLGLVLRELGSPGEALQALRQAAELQPDAETCRSVGLCLMDLGLIDEAVAGLEHALALNPDATETVIALSDALLKAGRFPDAIQVLQKALLRQPGNAQLHFAAGNAQRDHGQRQEAVTSYQKAIALDPRHYAARNNLGSLLYEYGELREAEQYFQAAVEIKPDAADIHFNLGTVLFEQGRTDAALIHSRTAVGLRPDALPLRQQFAQQIGAANSLHGDQATIAEMIRTYNTPGVDYQYLESATLQLLSNNSNFQLLEHIHARDGYNGIAKGLRERRFSALFHNPVLRVLLVQTVVCCARTELLLTSLRKALLQFSIGQWHQPDVDEIEFIGALACQCANNEYAYLAGPEELEQVDSLAETIDYTLADAPVDAAALQCRIAAMAMYRPLRQLKQWQKLLNTTAQTWPPGIQVLVERQIRHWAEEQDMREHIPRLTGIRTGVSSAVRTQYEESPYPRWISINLLKPRPYAHVLRELFPYFDPPRFSERTIDVLIAGCGTGKHAILSKTRFADSEHLAIDLSTASLAYAHRKAQEYGLERLHFAQADILELAGQPRRFHIIESVGVLHHMADPGAGLKVLADLLHPGGLMNIGLYSAQARRHITTIRDHFHRSMTGASEDFIRRARREVIDMAADNPVRTITRMADFYTLSECRDLLFHVQEHCFTLPQVQALLEQTGLRFLGFEYPDARIRRAYRHACPQDSRLTDLRCWDHFEKDHPDTFLGMYVFWCQKT